MILQNLGERGDEKESEEEGEASMLRAKRQKGGVMLEAVISLWLMLLSIGMNLELVRRAHWEVLIHHSAFMHARNRALGLSRRESVAKITHLFQRSWHRGTSIVRRLKFSEKYRHRGLEARVHIRYPALFSFPYKDYSKHHFEVTRKCIFPF